MNRRSFFSKLVAGLLAAPVIAKVIAEPKLIYFRGEDDYLRVSEFKMDGPQAVWIKGNFETGKTEWSLDGKEWVSGSAPNGSLVKSYESNGLSLRQDDPRFMPVLYASGSVKYS